MDKEISSAKLGNNIKNSSIKTERLNTILFEFEKVHFLGKKQINELKKIMDEQNDINEILKKWKNYLNESIYNDKFTEIFLKNIVEKHFNDDVLYHNRECC